MDKTLQDHVWKYYLPKEFKEEVKKLYTDALDASNSPHEPDDRKWGNYRVTLLEKLFGKHNLTSDAEGEEMLIIPRSKAIEVFRYFNNSPTQRHYFAIILNKLKYLFGTKCMPDEKQIAENVNCSDPKPAEVMTEERYQYLNSLSLEDYDNETSVEEQRRFCEYQHKHHPDEVIYLQTHSNDEEPKPAEPKFKVGDKVRLKDVYEIDEVDEDREMVGLKGCAYMEDFDNLEPYTEPILQPSSQVKETKASVETGDNLFGQHFEATSIATHGKTENHIADVGKMMRLNIAAIVLQGFVSNPDWSNFKEKNNAELRQKMAKGALDFADALIAESEKGCNK